MKILSYKSEQENIKHSVDWLLLNPKGVVITANEQTKQNIISEINTRNIYPEKIRSEIVRNIITVHDALFNRWILRMRNRRLFLHNVDEVSERAFQFTVVGGSVTD